MIRSFLVLALPLAISAASSSIVAAAADFDVDDVDFKAKVIASSINQFQGNRRKILNNAFRDLSLSDQCIAETEGLEESDFMQEIEFDSFDDAFLNNNCDLDIKKKKATCDLTDMFAGVKDSCGKEGGQVIRLKVTMVAEVTVIMKNISTCIGASCDVEEVIKYMQVEFDALGGELNPDATWKLESGAQSTRMHYGAAAASALAMAGVTFLN
mmetsp:Transcript_18133/g.26914  ORF Transcript_18133/g.26914 Transcript_18133/m.26914 type:complete len:212 (-) Transcript_18133:167-802(-)